MATGSNRRVRPRREDVRASVLEAATRAFERDGYADVSLATIATEAGYTKGAVYSGFTSKAELFAEACGEHLARTGREAMARMEPVLAVAHDRDAVLGDIADALTTITLDTPLRWQVLLNEFRAVAMRDPGVAEVYQRFTAHRVAFVTSMFRGNAYLARMDAATLERQVLVLLGMVNSLALEHAAAPNIVDRPTVRAILAAFLDAVLPRS